jgi:hypothetical protein
VELLFEGRKPDPEHAFEVLGGDFLSVDLRERLGGRRFPPTGQYRYQQYEDEAPESSSSGPYTAQSNALHHSPFRRPQSCGNGGMRIRVGMSDRYRWVTATATAHSGGHP